MGLVPHIKNISEERTINMVVTMVSSILMQAGMKCHKDTLFTDFGQQNGLFCMGLKLDSWYKVWYIIH